MPGALPRIIRVLVHYHAEEDHEPAPLLPGRGHARCGWTSRARSRLEGHGRRGVSRRRHRRGLRRRAARGARRGLRLSQGPSRPRRHRLRRQRDRASARLRDRAATSTSARRRPTSSTAGRSRSSSATAASTASARRAARASTRPRSACCATSATRTPSTCARRRGRLRRPRRTQAGRGRAPGATHAGRRRELMALEFAEAVRRIPVYPAADGYQLPDEVAHLASNESPFAPLPQVVRAAAKAAEGANRYPDPTGRPAAARARATATASPPRGSRSATARATCCWPPGTALLEPGAELVYAWPSFSMYPHLAAATGARPIVVQLDDEERHDLDRMAEEVTVATRMRDRLQPEQPDRAPRCPLAEIDALLERVPRHVCVIVDEAYCEFNTLDDPDASVDLLNAPSEPRAAADLLQGLRARRPARRLRAVRRRGLPRRRRPGASAVLRQRRRPRRRRPRRCATRTRSCAASSSRSPRASSSRRASRACGLPVAESHANFVWCDLGEDRDEARDRARPGRARRARARRRRPRARGRAARHLRHRRGESQVPRRAGRRRPTTSASSRRCASVVAPGVRCSDRAGCPVDACSGCTNSLDVWRDRAHARRARPLGPRHSWSFTYVYAAWRFS